jgi:CitMHS family citrate-Mg2+:H+ or citrate-Ca2+:H+ symporter
MYERKRLGVIELVDISHADDISISKDPDAQRPHLRWFNGILTLLLMASLVKGILPMSILFMLGFCIALVVNYPCVNMQKKRIAMHADSVLAVVGVIFAAGVFTGILSGTGMVEAMSKGFVAIIPPSMGPYLAPITGVLSMPLTFFMSNDAFYFGVLPILAEAASHYGIPPVEIARIDYWSADTLIITTCSFNLFVVWFGSCGIGRSSKIHFEMGIYYLLRIDG